jgi:short-subunit dehydrogenase
MTTPSTLGTALITGASTGIGAVYADRLAKRGHDLILVARDEARLNTLAQRLRAETGVKVDVLRADLTARPDLLAVELRLVGDPAITVLVNNAGIASAGDFIDTEVNRQEDLIELNVVVVTRLAHAAARAFVARGSGTIINIASVVALMPEFKSPVYGGSKAYVLHFTQALAQQLGDKVRLQAVLPGATRTEIWDRSGMGIDKLDPSILMGVDDLVDAALAGLDQGELITIPSLPDPADWTAFEAARGKLMPNLSRDKPAGRYGV